MIIIQGCRNIKSNGHINIFGGIFGVLDEKLRQIYTNNIIPAHENTSCLKRRTSSCNIDCEHSVYGIQSGYNISFLNKGKRL